MNSIVALPLAAVPTVSPALASPDEADRELVQAAALLSATDEAIERMHQDHAASGAIGDADEKPEYAALEDSRDEHIATLITVPATSSAGIRAKATAIRSTRTIEDYDQHQQIAVSLADDLVDGGVGPIVDDIVDRDSKSEALVLVDRCRKGNRLWDILADKIDEAEAAAAVELGYRPIPLVAWRNYSAIGESEIEGARDRFLREGVPANVVEAEYRDAKKRERDIELAGEEWDRKAGLTELRLKYEECRTETRTAWLALGKVRLTSVKDAAAIIGVLRKRMHTFNELSDDWEVAAFMNASRFLVKAAA